MCVNNSPWAVPAPPPPYTAQAAVLCTPLEVGSQTSEKPAKEPGAELSLSPSGAGNGWQGSALLPPAGSLW